MRILKQIYLSFVICSMAMTSAVADKPQIGVVDIQRLFKEYYRTEEAQKQFNQDYAAIQKTVNQQLEQINEMVLQLKSLNDRLKDENLDENARYKCAQEFKLIDKKRQALLAEMKQVEFENKKRVARRKAASLQGIMSEIRGKVISFADKQKYDFVFDESGKNTNQISFFIYLKDATDITSEMLKELNDSAPEGGGH
jgi:outer membrane protein